MEHNKEYFIFHEEKENILCKKDQKNALFTYFIAIKFTSARIDNIAD